MDVHPLQTQFPLSPRKFWKKMIQKTVLWGILGLAFPQIVLALLFFSANPDVLSVPYLFGLSVLVGIFAAIVSIVLYGLYVKSYIKRYYYSGSEDFVTIKKGVFAPTEIHVQYQKIQDVYVDQDILDRIMDLYDVHLASATITSGMEAHIDGVDHAGAEGLKNFLLEQIRGGSNRSSAAMAAASGAGGQQSANTPNQSITVDASKMISSDQYPIQPHWLTLRFVSACVSWALMVFFFVIFGWVRSKDGIPFSVLISWWPWYVVAIVMCAIGQTIYNAIWKSNYRFAFLQDYIQLSTKVIAQQETHMPYTSVQDVLVKQGVFERMFGLATVVIQNAAMMQVGNVRAPQGVNLPGQTLTSANTIAEVLRSIALSKNSNKNGL